MLMQSVIHVAVLTYFSVWCQNGTDFHLLVGKNAVAKPEEKVVLRETTLSEKCGLNLEPIVRPDEEIVALQSRARALTASLSLSEQIEAQPPETCPVPGQWKDEFAATWDDEQGFYFAGKHGGHFFPGSCAIRGRLEPIRCGEHEVCLAILKCDTPSDLPGRFYDIPEQYDLEGQKSPYEVNMYETQEGRCRTIR